MTDSVVGLVAASSALRGGSDRVVSWRGEIDGSLQNALGDAQIAASESETFIGNKDPWTGHAADGTIFWELFNPRFTKVRATLVSGGYKCWWTFAGNLRGKSWRTNYKENLPLRLEVQIQNASEGVLLRDFVQRHMLCREEASWFMSKDFTPDVYEEFKGFSVSNLPTMYYEC
jgi:hypothetical protein